MEKSNTPLRLTQTVQKGGCAAKVPAVELRKILQNVKFPPNDKNVLVDGGLFDDAAIYKISDDMALVQTLDFFTPIVDSPSAFGKLAAANALSDIYAMGGIPKTALGILAFPLSRLDNSVAIEVLQGASDLLKEAQCNFVGGHSIDDDTLKFGLSVTGIVNPQKIWSNDKAQDGDYLLLTKALGTGTFSAALKRDRLQENEMKEVLSSMTQLNSLPQLMPADLLLAVHAATDITGFGLAGHALQMARASGCQFVINFKEIPAFDGALSLINESFLTKAHRSNFSYVSEEVDWTALSDSEKNLVCDPQTSGGLLLAVAPELVDVFFTACKKHFIRSSIIGRIKKNQSSSVGQSINHPVKLIFQ